MRVFNGFEHTAYIPRPVVRSAPMTVCTAATARYCRTWKHWPVHGKEKASW